MAALGFDNTIKAGISSRPVLPNSRNTMTVLNQFQLEQKHAPPFSTDCPLRIPDQSPILQCPQLSEFTFKQRCTLKDRAYKFARIPGGLS